MEINLTVCRDKLGKKTKYSVHELFIYDICQHFALFKTILWAM